MYSLFTGLFSHIAMTVYSDIVVGEFIAYFFTVLFLYIVFTFVLINNKLCH